MQHTLNIDGYGLLAAREAIAPSDESYAFVRGHQYKQMSGDIDRFVDLTLVSRESYATPSLYATAHLSPDEARGLAYRLLDAADDADERADEPVGYALTGKPY